MSDAELLLVVEARKKSGLVAALLNLFLPGAGYIYCGRWILGIVAFIFTVALIIYSLGIAVVGVVLMLIIDGFLCAGRYNQNVIKQALHERAGGEGAAKDPPVPHPVSLPEHPVPSSAQERPGSRTVNVSASGAAATAASQQTRKASAGLPISKNRSLPALIFGALLMAAIGAAAVFFLLPGLGDRLQLARPLTVVTPPTALLLEIDASNSKEPRVEATSSQPALTEQGSLETVAAAGSDLMESITTNIDNSATRVRAKPDTNAEVVKVLPPDTAVWIRNEAYKPNDWTEVRLAASGPVLGWVRNDRLHDFRTEKQ